MSQSAYIRDMMADPAPDPAIGPSEIASFYTGCNVLITGATGFLGRLLAERILRSCSEINTLFLLLRTKKGKSPEERFDIYFDDIIFDRLKRERPAFSQKVVLIEGDMVKEGLGLSPEQKELLRTTHVVLHGAATVRFDEKMRIAAGINVGGTKELLLFAKEMRNLKAFVHVSTAYSNCINEVIEEKFYPPAMDYEKLLNLLDMLDDASLENLTPVLLGKWPNTYAFTKAIAEDTIRRNCHSLPICIVRPSIVIATSKEPVAGWINNVYGATGILVGVGVGVLRTLHCNGELVADMIPADYVVSNIIAAAWDIANVQSMNMNNQDISMVPDVVEPPIYNVVSSCQKPIKWHQFSDYSGKYHKKFPSMETIWYHCFKLNKYRWVHNIYVIFLHLIPAVIMDSLAWLTGRKPMLLKTYRKIHKFSTVLEYFTMQQWRFCNNNVLRLWEKLSSTDRSEFDFNVGNLNWEDYSYRHVRGLRVYLVKDPLDTVPQASVRFAKLKLAHYTVVTAFWGLIFWLLFTFLRFIGLW